ncbi:MAG: DUF5696 domain-containing protein [Saccharofermentanales bacterium]
MKLQTLYRNSIVLLIISVLLVSMPSGISAEEEIPAEVPEMVGMLENDRFTLNVNETTGQFNLVNKGTGKIWWSTPPDADADEMANGRNRMEMKSNLIIRYADAKTGEIDLANTYTGSVVPGTVEVKKTEDAVRIAYKMVDYKLYIPMQIRLTEEGISCSILSDEIIEGGDYAIYTISMLPYFGAAYQDEEGYLFIPDGSGAIVHFNNQKGSYTQYSDTVYGTDYNFDIVQKTNAVQSVRMPVYGIKVGNDGLLGIISAGSGIAEIDANVSGSNTGYSNVFASFNMRYIGAYYLGQSLGGATKLINIFDRNPISIDKIEVELVVLDGEDSGYVGMAKAYRDYLIVNCNLKKLSGNEPELHLEMIGSVRKTVRILGIPFTVTRAVTTFQKAQEILEELQDNGIENIAVRYLNWENKAIRGKLSDSSSVVGRIGGKAGLKKLNNYAAGKNISISLDKDFLLAYDFSLAYPKSKNTAISLSKKIVNFYQYSYVNYFKEPLERSRYLISPVSAGKIFDRFTMKYDRLGVSSISMGNIGDILYSDFSTASQTRDDAANQMAGILEKAKEKNGLMVKGGNAYTFPYADRIIDAPNSSSNYDIEDQSVPFYQIALYGYIRNSSTPVNDSSNPRKEFLRAIEYCSSLHYTWIGSDMSELKDSEFDDMKSADYSDWIDTAIQYSKELNALYDKTEDSDVRSHSIVASGVSLLSWENGLEVYINYNKESVSVDGNTIEGEGYLVLENK